MAFSIDHKYLNNLSTAEYKILEYIVKNEKRISDMTVQMLADTTFVSTATIMRLCKKLGYSGFSELKYHLKSAAEIQSPSTNLSILDMKNIIVNDIEHLSHSINYEMVEAVTELLLSNKNIHFFAKGITSCVLSYFAKYLQTCSRKNVEYLDTHIAYLNANQMGKDDVFFVASLSGLTSQVLKASQIAKVNGAIIVAFTSMNNNPISELADYNFYITSHKNSKNFEFDINSRLGMYFVIDLIIMSYLSKIQN